MKRGFLPIIVMACLCYRNPCFASCNDMKGLDVKRAELEKRYDKDVDNDYLKNREKADTYRKQIRDIDSIYRNFIYDLFFEYEAGRSDLLQRCSKALRKDKYLYFVYKFLEYRHSESPEEFFRDMPTDKENMAPLWALDEITGGSFGPPNPHPKLFDVTSFVDSFLDTIYEMAAKGNGTAIDRLLKISTFADGEYGEYMEEKVLDLFALHSDVVLRNWRIIKKYEPNIHLESTDYISRADSIIEEYQDACGTCNVESSTCNEVIEFLRREKLNTENVNKQIESLK